VVSEALRQRALDVASHVPDPELPMLTVTDLGILRDVAVHADGTVELSITPTYSGCPAMELIAQELRRALTDAGIIQVRIRTVLSPPWTTDWISADGRRKLAENGIAPPTQTTPACPHCGSAETEMISAFGSTACKALWRCNVCGEPFDHFKCH